LVDGRDWGQSMVKEIRIYIEGGGDKKDTKKAMRIDFSEFLKEIYFAWHLECKIYFASLLLNNDPFFGNAPRNKRLCNGGKYT